MSWIDEELVGLDLETTGPDPLTAIPVSYAVAHVDFGVVRTRHELVNPGIPIPEGAMKVHGITDEVASTGADLNVAVFELKSKLTTLCQEGVPVVGMNVVFDLTIIDCRAKELLGEGLRESGWWGPVIDVMVLDKHYDRYRKGSRKLVAMCEHYGVEMGDAHAARDDALATLRILRAMTASDRFKGLKQRSLADLHQDQVEWHTEQMTSLSEHFVSKGKPPIPPEEFGWPLHDRPPQV